MTAEDKFQKTLSFLYIALFAVIPWSLAAMQIMLGLVIICFIILSVAHKRNYLKFNVFYIFPGIFFLLLGLSAAFSVDPKTSFNNIIHTYWVMLTLPFIASLPLAPSVREKAVNALIISSTIVGTYAIFQFFTGINLISDMPLNKLQISHFYRGMGTYGFYLTFAGNQLMVFALAFLYYLEDKSNQLHKRFLIMAILIIGMSLIATQARSTWLGVIFLIILGTFLFHRKHFVKISAVLIVLFLIVIISLPDILDRFLGIFNPSHQHNIARLNLWKTSILIIADHPLIGIGPGLYQLFFETYKIPGFYDAISHPHSDYLLTAVQSGITGLISWLTIWFVFLKMGFKYIFDPNSVSSDVLIVKGIVLAIGGILIAAFFQCYFVDLENSILWWLLVATSIQILNRSKFAVG